MPAESANPTPATDFLDPRFTQISECHCGPATIQMLLYYLGIEVSQDAVCACGDAVERIEEHGMRPDQLAQAIRRLAPQARFWWKDHATLDELVEIVNRRGYPVGVEWQGLFWDTVEEETGDDHGHYSVVVAADPEKRELMIADPYKDYRSALRTFSFDFFLTRWWDVNENPQRKRGQARCVEDRQMLFVITLASETWPAELGLRSE